MKITGTTGPSATNASSKASAPKAGPGGFAVSNAPATAAPAATSATMAASSVSDVSALMALQGVEGPLERRRRAVKRGGRLLDRLDELKMALLSGESGGLALEGLAQAIREERPEDADPGLTAILDQIDIRASVELAKAELRRQAS